MPKISRPSPSSRGRTGTGGLRLFVHLRVMIAAALLCALSIIFGKYLAFNVTGSIRFSLENLPILLAGVYFGPLVGGIVGVAADLIGCMLVGYTPIPLVTVGAVVVGATSGAVVRYICPRRPDRIGTPWVFVPVMTAHALGSVLVKSIGLSHYTGVPFPVTLGWRALTYLCIGILEGGIILLLSKNKLFTGELTKLTRPRPDRRDDRDDRDHRDNHDEGGARP